MDRRARTSQQFAPLAVAHVQRRALRVAEPRPLATTLPFVLGVAVDAVEMVLTHGLTAVQQSSTRPRGQMSVSRPRAARQAAGAYGGVVATGLILVAASGLALEVAEAARASGRAVLGCVDDDATRWGQLAGGWLPVLGGLDLVVAHPDAPLVVCAGRGQVRAGLVDRLSLIHISE